MNSAGYDVLLEPDAPGANLPHLERDVAATFHHASELDEDLSHRRAPVLELPEDCQPDARWLDATEPATEPVVAGVVDNVEKRRRGDDQIDRRRVDGGR